ncbi:ABC transporter permease [Fulvivirgaceae bacterium PWU4]|uniref:ABC transporter permease n=1 Tax=Chryseosolibacter histidini TaxID=2782349 RepID=A0AAP2DNR6_9BACT|nr:ABC transporter permease [Chryseosolibacter histidini]MBT1699766.1 ABC transporter permease [Chryseosolibacter histidini]
MFKNYFTIGLRNLLKHKGYSFIKIAGLALGLAASMIIYLYVREDLSYDTFHKQYRNIVRVLTIDSAEGVSSKLVGVTQPQLGPVATEELPEVLKSVRFTGGGRYDLSYGDNALKCEAAFRVDPSVFEVFDFKVVDGATTEILDQPGSIAITQSLAKKIFGDENAIGKTVKLNQTTDLHVTAVLADPPKNSHLQFDLLRTLVPGQGEDGLRQSLETWQGIFCFTYLLLDKPADITDLNRKLQSISKKNNAYEFFTPVVQKLEDVHLGSKEILFETNANKSDRLNVYVLSIIATLILVLAAVNFMNLVTARSAGRAKEVGMRKVIGAVRYQLIGQHLTESILVTLIGAVFAFAVVFALVPILNSNYQRFADFNILLEPLSLLMVTAMVLIVGTLAGLYPAFVLSGFKPVLVLKGSFKNSTSGIRLRKALVVLQFTISIALMVGTGIVYQQMNFIYTADLGYSRDQVISVQQSGAAVGRASTLRDELLRNKDIAAVGTSSARIGQQLGRTNIVPEGATSATNIITSIMSADESFIPAMNMEMIAGRNFSLDFDDSLSMIINEEMTRLLKWNDPVGKKISLQSGPNPTDLTAYTVIGVVKDFHFATIRHRLEPMFMLYNQNNPAMSVKVKAGNVKETIAYIEETWKKVNPGSTFEYAFLDEQFANLYRNEQAFASMFTHFTLLAMVIAGLGLFALSAFTAEQRRKEIGIRKVLGASNVTILYKLSSEFIRLIFVAFLMASVAAYFVMSAWLEDFQYSIKLGAGIFIVAGLAAFAIAMITISFQALKAAMGNPVESLRSE